MTTPPKRLKGGWDRFNERAPPEGKNLGFKRFFMPRQRQEPANFKL